MRGWQGLGCVVCVVFAAAVWYSTQHVESSSQDVKRGEVFQEADSEIVQNMAAPAPVSVKVAVAADKATLSFPEVVQKKKDFSFRDAPVPGPAVKGPGVVHGESACVLHVACCL